MERVKIFENAEFGQVRTITIENEPWFVGKQHYKHTKTAVQ